MSDRERELVTAAYLRGRKDAAAAISLLDVQVEHQREWIDREDAITAALGAAHDESD